MNTAGLMAALQAAGLPADWEDVRDSLWLAAVLAGDRPDTGSEREPDAEPDRAPVVDATPTTVPDRAPDTGTAVRPPRLDGRDGPPPTAPAYPEPVGVYLSGDAPAAGRGHRVRLAMSPPRLDDAAAVARRLRPLKRRLPTHGRPVVDEVATVERIAETEVWQPVLTAPVGRWLDLDVVVDDGPSMALWDRSTAALVELLTRLGVFRRVTVWRLDADEQRAVLRGAGRDPAPQDPRRLVDPTGRTVVLVVSDGVGPGWRSGSVDRALAQWAAVGPAAIWQPLAPRLWRRTAMRVRGGVLGAARAGAPTAECSVRVGGEPYGSGIPVLGSGQASLGDWARLLAVGGSAATPLRLLDPGGAAASPASTEDIDPHAVITRFRTESSATAMRLALYLSAVPLTMATMRVAQEMMLPESAPSHLAEVFLGGLLRRLPNPEGATDPVYDFVPGVREALLAATSRTEVRRVLARVADADALPLAERRGFRALLDDPHGTDVTAATPLGRPFARVMHTVLGRLDAPAGNSAAAPSAPGPPAVRDAEIVERTDRQLLAFGWAEGATSVLVYIAGPGQGLDAARRGAPQEITARRYRVPGGTALRSRLPSIGCSVHIVPVTDGQGGHAEGAAVALEYPGLLRLHYRVRTTASGTDAAVVRILSELDVEVPPMFVLVHRPDRLPLHAEDGRPLPVVPDGVPGAPGDTMIRPTDLIRGPEGRVWITVERPPTGWVRLFAVVPSEGRRLVALIDPPVESLRIGPPMAVPFHSDLV